jgi:hypothetical protein
MSIYISSLLTACAFAFIFLAICRLAEKACLQSGRLRVAGGMKLGPVLQAEMLNFRVKLAPKTSHDSYSAWRESEHDDLVLSVAMAA